MQKELVKELNISVLKYGEVITLEALWKSYSYYLKQMNDSANNLEDIINLFLCNYSQNGMCLYKENDNWYIYNYHDGIKKEEKIFSTCYEACISILVLLSNQINDYDNTLLNIFLGNIKGLHSDTKMDSFTNQKINIKRR